MEYRPFGRTGVRVSPLCLGSAMFGLKNTREEAYDVMDRAIDTGINFMDTANVYSHGLSEEVVGEGLQRNGKRDRIVLATKVHGQMDPDDPNSSGNSRRHIIQQCEASLRRLKTDYIDLYQLHRPQSDIPVDETLRVMDDLIRSGKVRYAGTSTFAAWTLVNSFWVSKELGLNRFVCDQPPYSILDRRIERDLVPMAENFGMAIIPWSPLGEGILTGKYRRNEPVPEKSRLTMMSEQHMKTLLTDRTFDVIEALEAIAKDKGCTISQLSLAWCMNQPGVTAPIMGPNSMKQLEDNLGALNLEITGEDRARIDAIVPPGCMAIPYYEGDWRAYKYR